MTRYAWYSSQMNTIDPGVTSEDLRAFVATLDLPPPLDPARFRTNLTSVARRDWQLTLGNHDFHAALGAARLAT